MPVPIHPQGRQGVVLVCDEESDFHQLVREALSGTRLRLELEHARSAEECLARLRTGSPGADLLLLDLNLPRLDGFDALARIRAEPLLRTLPVVVYASAPRAEDVRRMYELGCNTFIRKPATLPALRRDLARVVRYWFQLALIAPR